MKKLLAVAVAALLSVAAFAETAAEIMKKSCNIDPPQYSISELQFDLYNKNGNLEDSRILMQYGKHEGGNISTVFDFVKSNQIKGTRFLQIEKSNKTDDKWIYMPALGQVRRVNVTERKKSFVNSDFTYNDMTIRNENDDSHEFVNEDESVNIAGKSYKVWRIKSTPVANKDQEFASRIICVEKTTYLPIIMEYYDKAGKLIKTITVEELRMQKSETGKTYPIRAKVVSEDKRNGHKSVAIVRKQTLDKKVEDRYFTQNWLQTGK